MGKVTFTTNRTSKTGPTRLKDILCVCKSWQEYYFMLNIIVIIQHTFRSHKKAKSHLSFSTILHAAVAEFRDADLAIDGQKEKDLIAYF